MPCSSVIARLAPCALLIVPACAHEAAPEPTPPASAPPTDERPCPPPTHAHGSRWQRALDAVTPAPDQLPTIGAIRQRVRERHAASVEAHAEARRSLASEVRAGRVAPHEADVATMHERIEQRIGDLNLLHATLTPEQRRQWSAALLEDVAARRRHRSPRHGANARHGADRLVADLNLTAEQRAAWDRTAPSANPAGSGAPLVAIEPLASAFEQEVFDARDSLPGPKPTAAFLQRHGHLRTRLAELAPLLTIEQRNTLADRVAAGACGK